MWKMEEKICDYQDYKDEVEIPDLDTEPITFKEDRNMDFSLGTFYQNVVFMSCRCRFSGHRIIHENGDTGRNSGETMVTYRID